MAAIFCRVTTNYLVRSHPRNLSTCSIWSGIAPSRLQQPSIRHLSSSASFSAPKISNKRISSKQANSSTGEGWSIIAYNLSEELRIENAKLLLENFKEYDLVELPEDLQDEAVMLSLKKTRKTKDEVIAHQPRHDVFLFREGAIVFWGVAYDQQKRILYSLASLKVEPIPSTLIQEEKEHLNYSLTASSDRSKLNRDIVQLAVGQNFDHLCLDQFAFSHAIALSVKLAIWETMLDRYIESIGWVTSSMKTGKKIDLTRSQVFCKTGEIYELKHHINLSSDLLDLPDIYWDRHNQEVMFLSMASFLNMKKRTAVMNEKLNNCCELMNLLSGHMNDKHHVRLEWMIIVLIMVEVLFEISRFF